MDCSPAFTMVLGERLAVMNSIHQSESYTALLSFSIRFCLGGLPELMLIARYVPCWLAELSASAFLRMHATDALTLSALTLRQLPGAQPTVGQAREVVGMP